MSDNIKNKDIDMNDVNFVPVRPEKTYKVPYLADPIEFMVYGDRSLDSFTTEVKKMEAELRREIYHSEKADYPIDKNEENIKAKKAKSLQNKKKVKGSSIIAIIFGLLTLIMLVIGKWLKIDEIPTLFTLVNGIDGYTFVMNGIDSLSQTNVEWTNFIIPCCIMAIAFINLILILNGAFGIVSKGTSMFAKIISTINFVLAIIIFVILLAVEKTVINEINYGLWIVIGLTFIVFIVTILSRRKPKAKNMEE